MELTLDLPAPHEADVAASRGGTTWTVAELGWRKLLADPPEDDVERYPAPDEPCAGTRTSCTPQFLAPALPRAYRSRRRA
jgi:hypothetical protein